MHIPGCSCLSPGTGSSRRCQTPTCCLHSALPTSTGRVPSQCRGSNPCTPSTPSSAAAASSTTAFCIVSAVSAGRFPRALSPRFFLCTPCLVRAGVSGGWCLTSLQWGLRSCRVPRSLLHRRLHSLLPWMAERRSWPSPLRAQLAASELPAV